MPPKRTGNELTRARQDTKGYLRALLRHSVILCLSIKGGIKQAHCRYNNAVRIVSGKAGYRRSDCAFYRKFSTSSTIFAL
jgi:hypothetical protein